MTMKNEQKYTYTEAFEELQRIVGEIERGEILIDELSEKVRRAKDLIAVCKSKLVDTEEDVSKLLANLAAGNETGGDSREPL